ncbi:hypothetical protein HK405_011486, partial [Cladochytrium tenue]
NPSKDREVAFGKAIADAAVAAGTQYIVWSTLPHANRRSGGRLTHVAHFDGKAEVEEYIRRLPVRSAFFSPGVFMQNLVGIWAPRPSAAGDGPFDFANTLAPTTPLPFIDVVGDSGKFVGAILADPDRFSGRVVCAATALYTPQDVAAAMSAASGKTVRHVQLPDDVFRGLQPPVMASELVEMFQLFRDYLYFGPNQEELVAWGSKHARGKVTTLEEFFVKNPLKLE